MVHVLGAVFDGKVLHLDAPLPIEPNTRVRLTIEMVTEPDGKPASFLRTARSLQLDGPEDWSTNLDSYLYDENAPDGR